MNIHKHIKNVDGEWTLRNDALTRALNADTRALFVEICKKKNARCAVRITPTPEQICTDARLKMSYLLNKKREILDMIARGNGETVGDKYIVYERSEIADWNYYAKSYKYPRVKVFNRAILFDRFAREIRSATMKTCADFYRKAAREELIKYTTA